MMLSFAAIMAIVTLLTVYFFLITEKIDKVIVTGIGAAFLIVTQVFRSQAHSSQENAFEFVSRNLDVLGFIVGMMVLVAIVRQSGAFEAVAVWMVKLTRGRPAWLLVGVGYLAFIMTVFLSNIPTILILTPVLLVLIRQLKLPHLPFFFIMIAMANIAGATTPISDPTTYYEAKTVGLSFLEVVSNSGVIALLLSVVTAIYCSLVFRSQLAKVKVSAQDVSLFNPASAIRDRFVLKVGIPLLLGAILIVVFKEQIGQMTGFMLDNATVIGGAALLAMLIFRVDPHKALQEYVGWEIIFFFLGLFVVVGALEFTGVIGMLGHGIVALTGGNTGWLLFVITMGSSLLSVFIDNVPYNITMVGAIQAMAQTGIVVYPLWWALNVGTSIGGAGSMIGAACNVIALGQAEKEKFHTNFLTYLKYGVPLVMLNGSVAFLCLAVRYLR
jgi:Na+/H+ antiporter NhaD/arsenite permease-like protein